VRKTLWKTVIIMFAVLGVAAASSSGNAEEGCPPGQHPYRMGGCKQTLTPAKTYAQCIKNAQLLGYSPSDPVVLNKCKQWFPH
jgi:hypothetical protein